MNTEDETERVKRLVQFRMAALARKRGMTKDTRPTPDLVRSILKELEQELVMRSMERTVAVVEDATNGIPTGDGSQAGHWDNIAVLLGPDTVERIKNGST